MMLKTLIFVFLALTSTTVCLDELILTSNDKIQVIPLKSLDEIAAAEAAIQSDNQTTNVSLSLLPEQLPAVTPNLQKLPTQTIQKVLLNYTYPIIYAKIQEPSFQVRSINARNNRIRSYFIRNRNITTPALSTQSQKSLTSSKWIFSGQLGTENIVFLTPCLYNSCPKSQYTIYVQTTCDFTIQLINQFHKTVVTIGNGAGWLFYGFKFNSLCGKYRIKITLNCQCPFCSYTRFNLLQDKKDCFICPNNLNHNYNITTCSCQCANSFACKSVQKWYGYPDCTCGCKKQTQCKTGEYFDKKQYLCKKSQLTC